MKKTLTNREKEKLSRILEIDGPTIEKLSEHDVLDTSACRAAIIRSEYMEIKIRVGTTADTSPALWRKPTDYP